MYVCMYVHTCLPCYEDLALNLSSHFMPDTSSKPIDAVSYQYGTTSTHQQDGKDNTLAKAAVAMAAAAAEQVS